MRAISSISPSPCHPATLQPRHPRQVGSLGIHILDVLGGAVTRIPPKQDVGLLEEIRLTVAGTAAGTSVDRAKLGADILAMGAIGEEAAGSFIVGLLRGWDLAECARFGTAAAGLVIGGLGSEAGIVDFDHTFEFMQSAEMLPGTD